MEEGRMTGESFYLICFLVGFLLSGLSLMLGAFHFHMPGGGDLSHLHVGAPHAGGGDGGGSDISPLNFGTIAAFLAWFGGTGYLLERYSRVWAAVIVLLAAVSGLGGAAAVFWFLMKVLLRQEKALDPADYDMVGVLGKVSSAVRPDGVGEMIYSQEGVRHACAIRSEDGSAIPREVEVVVTRYEGGIAYVRRWDELSGLDEGSGTQSAGSR